MNEFDDYVDAKAERIAEICGCSPQDYTVRQMAEVYARAAGLSRDPKPNLPATGNTKGKEL